MKKPLWRFVDDKGSFESENANKINSLYFPLCNTAPIMSSVTPDLHGDIKTSNNTFLLEPVSRINLSTSKATRNFWIYINPDKIWSATGVSKDGHTIDDDEFKLEAGFLWHKIIRQNKKIGLCSEIISFIPSSNEPAEIMVVEIKNISKAAITFVPTAAIPVFARSADNLRDHRHVSSLLKRIELDKFGIVVTPTLVFDESGHKPNKTSYFVLGSTMDGGAPLHIYPTQEDFTGDGSDLEHPEAIFKNTLPDNRRHIQGREALAGLRFKEKTLKPGQSYSYILVMGIADDAKDVKTIFNKFNAIEKIEASLGKTKEFWTERASDISVNTGNTGYDNWVRWVSIQPMLRQIFGCSFLPDFDYGRGGRGWRDLWQDCLSLILSNPKDVRSMLTNNYSGVRIDGSNATIIGQKPGEFIADRNKISRVWMDHGVWPLVTTMLYIHNTGDIKILLEETSYFRDHQISRGREIDKAWAVEYGKEAKTCHGRVYKGTILEHILIENLVQFFNVGPHNHIRMENADWNDGLDMAPNHGESVAFSSMYARNLRDICEALERLGETSVTVLKELIILLDFLTSLPVNYADVGAKHKVLNDYFKAVNLCVDGERVSVPVDKLILDLRKKADSIEHHIRNTEWLDEGFFNGYYDDDKTRVEGMVKGALRMTLTGQTFPVMSGIAKPDEIKTMFKNAQKHLQHYELGGFRLNTDFKEEMHSLGRAFSFIYGDKENGAFFNHMAVMFAYGLYSRGFAKEGYEVFNAIYKMAADTERSKIYPCLPEYFDATGRGMYSYLTGSASWYILTLLTQVFGIKGHYGELVIEPKLTADQFAHKHTIYIMAYFAGRRIKVIYKNPEKKEFGKYTIKNAALNQKAVQISSCGSMITIPRRTILNLADEENLIEITLG